MWLRHLAAIALLPFSVAVLVPLWLVRRNGVVLALGDSAAVVAAQVVGVALLALGLTLFVASLRRFASEGHGTLAPWDPPRELVVAGPYRYVRNPMISGVVLTLFAEALVLLSLPHLARAAAFLTLNAIYLPIAEEPQLARRFGAAYREYCANVPRVIPRATPWTPPRASH
ncbi:MAG: isoprenylcysteine carboxylmethyltransferase family protein [Deltaproteobacteria bacterium]|nr:isoprenylcysteine carboxylmethyltransferase family protein [Deltaproteobacteria bacterium]